MKVVFNKTLRFLRGAKVLEYLLEFHRFSGSCREIEVKAGHRRSLPKTTFVFNLCRIRCHEPGDLPFAPSGGDSRTALTPAYRKSGLDFLRITLAIPSAERANAPRCKRTAGLHERCTLGSRRFLFSASSLLWQRRRGWQPGSGRFCSRRRIWERRAARWRPHGQRSQRRDGAGWGRRVWRCGRNRRIGRCWWRRRTVPGQHGQRWRLAHRLPRLRLLWKR